MNIQSLACLGLTLGLLTACRATAPSVASPVAHGPPGPTPELPNGGPQGAPPPAPIAEDRVVAQAVRDNLRKDPGLPAGASDHITVRVSKGIVTLRGILPATTDRAALFERLGKLPGVDRIQDELGGGGE